MTDITWEPDVPADIRAILAPHLERWKGLVPTWCQEFVVRYDPNQDGRMAARINHRNRWAILIVTGHWLAEPDAERECSLVHELVHIALEPMASAAGRIIEDVIEDGTPLRELADSMFTDGMEASVEDLARGILRLAS